jgi:hypothetical protein
MIGSGTPISHNKAPRPKPILSSSFLQLNNVQAFGQFLIRNKIFRHALSFKEEPAMAVVKTPARHPFFLQDVVDKHEGRYRDVQLPLPMRLF